MLKIGDVVAHPRYGIAFIESMRTTQYQNQTKRYYCLRLATEKDKSMVLIPEDAIETAGLRTTLLNEATIQETMSQPPVKLEGDIRVRQDYIKTKMRSRDPQELVGLLRDLCWYEQTQRLSQAESRSREELLTTLGGELSASQQVSPLAAKHTLDAIIAAAMANHQAAKTVN